MENAPPRVSVIVLLERGEREPCLPALLRQSLPDFEVIAVVNPGMKLNKDPRVTVLEMEEKNPARRRNLAAGQARAPLLAFIDDDAAAPADWLEKGVKALEEHPQWAGLGGPNLLFADADLREWVSDLILATPFIGSGNPTYRPGRKTRRGRPGDLHLCNMFLRRQVFNQVGGFNEALGYGGEDSEFLYVADRGLGAEFWFVPEVWVHHRRRPFGPEFLTQRFRFRRQNGRLIWAYPGMYAGNKTLLAACAGLLILLLAMAVHPAAFYFFLLVYLHLTIILSLPRLRKRFYLLPLVPLFFALHHAAYALGLLAGLAEGIGDHGQRLRWAIARDIFAQANKE